MRLAQLAMGMTLLAVISTGCSSPGKEEAEYEFDRTLTGASQSTLRAKVAGEIADDAMLKSVRFYCYANRKDLAVTLSADSSLLVTLPWPDIHAKEETVLQNDTAIVLETSYNNILTMGESSCELKTTFRRLIIPFMLGGGIQWRVSMVTIGDASQEFNWQEVDTATVVLRREPARRLELQKN